MFRRFLKALILEARPVDNIGSIEAFNIPENDAILGQFHKFAPTYAYSDRIKERRGRNAIMRQLDGHPDLHHYLWQCAGVDLPSNTRWIVRAHAAFAHPETKIIFAVAGGPDSIQIRLPVATLNAFPELPRRNQDATGGPFAWIASRLNETEDKQLLRIAYEAAALASAP